MNSPFLKDSTPPCVGSPSGRSSTKLSSAHVPLQLSFPWSLSPSPIVFDSSKHSVDRWNASLTSSASSDAVRLISSKAKEISNANTKQRPKTSSSNSPGVAHRLTPNNSGSSRSESSDSPRSSPLLPSPAFLDDPFTSDISKSSSSFDRVPGSGHEFENGEFDDSSDVVLSPVSTLWNAYHDDLVPGEYLVSKEGRPVTVRWKDVIGDVVKGEKLSFIGANRPEFPLLTSSESGTEVSADVVLGTPHLLFPTAEISSVESSGSHLFFQFVPLLLLQDLVISKVNNNADSSSKRLSFSRRARSLSPTERHKSELSLANIELLKQGAKSISRILTADSTLRKETYAKDGSSGLFIGADAGRPDVVVVKKLMAPPPLEVSCFNLPAAIPASDVVMNIDLERDLNQIFEKPKFLRQSTTVGVKNFSMNDVDPVIDEIKRNADWRIDDLNATRIPSYKQQQVRGLNDDFPEFDFAKHVSHRSSNMQRGGDNSNQDKGDNNRNDRNNNTSHDDINTTKNNNNTSSLLARRRAARIDVPRRSLGVTTSPEEPVRLGRKMSMVTIPTAFVESNEHEEISTPRSKQLSPIIAEVSFDNESEASSLDMIECPPGAENVASFRKDVRDHCGAFVFADITGFTKMVEKAAELGDAGVENVTVVLNSLFNRLVNAVMDRGGDVIKFAGDALLAFFPIKCGDIDKITAEEKQKRLRHVTIVACTAALSMQEEIVVSRASRVRLRVGVACGDCFSAHYGGISLASSPVRRWEFVFSGLAITNALSAQTLAAADEVSVAPDVFSLIKEHFEWKRVEKNCAIISTPKESTISSIASRSEYCQKLGLLQSSSRVVSSISATPEDDPESIVDVDIKRIIASLNRKNRAVLSAYVAGKMLNFDASTGMGRWVSECRNISVVALKLDGIDFNSKTSIPLLQSCVCKILMILRGYDGGLNKILVDDKGFILLLAFGLPSCAHENDPSRALEFAVEVANDFSECKLHSVCVKLGVSTGRSYCGVIGGERRCEYTMIGQVVNSAFFMLSLHPGVAGYGIVHCDLETYENVGNVSSITFTEEKSRVFKGSSGKLSRIFSAKKTKMGHTGIHSIHVNDLLISGDENNLLADDQGVSSDSDCCKVSFAPLSTRDRESQRGDCAIDRDDASTCSSTASYASHVYNAISIESKLMDIAYVDTLFVGSDIARLALRNLCCFSDKEEIAPALSRFSPSTSRFRIMYFEGELGYGKTRLLNYFQFICQIGGLCYFRNSQTRHVAHGASECEFFKPILVQFLSHALFNSGFSIDEKNLLIHEIRTLFLLICPPDRIGDCCEEDIFIVKMVKSLQVEQPHLIAEEKLQVGCQNNAAPEEVLLEFLCRSFKCGGLYESSIFIVDDTSYLSQNCWNLIIQFLTNCTRIVAVMSSRPLSHLSTTLSSPTDSDMSPVARRDKDLQLLDAVTYLLEPLNEGDVENLISLLFHVSSATSAVVELFNVAEGNPLFIIELGRTLWRRGVIGRTSDLSSLIIRSSRGQEEGEIPVFRGVLSLPPLFYRIFAADMNKLPPSAQLTLKLCVILGRTFQLRLLKDCLLNLLKAFSNRKFHKTMKLLVELGLLVFLKGVREFHYYSDGSSVLLLGDSCIPDDDVNEITVAFRLSALRETIYDIILGRQRSYLHLVIAHVVEDTIRSRRQDKSQLRHTEPLEMEKVNSGLHQGIVACRRSSILNTGAHLSCDETPVTIRSSKYIVNTRQSYRTANNVVSVSNSQLGSLQLAAIHRECGGCHCKAAYFYWCGYREAISLASLSSASGIINSAITCLQIAVDKNFETENEHNCSWCCFDERILIDGVRARDLLVLSSCLFHLKNCFVNYHLSVNGKNNVDYSDEFEATATIFLSVAERLMPASVMNRRLPMAYLPSYYEDDIRYPLIESVGLQNDLKQQVFQQIVCRYVGRSTFYSLCPNSNDSLDWITVSMLPKIAANILTHWAVSCSAPLMDKCGRLSEKGANRSNIIRNLNFVELIIDLQSRAPEFKHSKQYQVFIDKLKISCLKENVRSVEVVSTQTQCIEETVMTEGDSTLKTTIASKSLLRDVRSLLSVYNLDTIPSYFRAANLACGYATMLVVLQSCGPVWKTLYAHLIEDYKILCFDAIIACKQKDALGILSPDVTSLLCHAYLTTLTSFLYEGDIMAFIKLTDAITAICDVSLSLADSEDARFLRAFYYCSQGRFDDGFSLCRSCLESAWERRDLKSFCLLLAFEKEALLSLGICFISGDHFDSKSDWFIYSHFHESFAVQDQVKCCLEAYLSWTTWLIDQGAMSSIVELWHMSNISFITFCLEDHTDACRTAVVVMERIGLLLLSKSTIPLWLGFPASRACGVLLDSLDVVVAECVQLSMRDKPSDFFDSVKATLTELIVSCSNACDTLLRLATIHLPLFRHRAYILTARLLCVAGNDHLCGRLLMMSMCVACQRNYVYDIGLSKLAIAKYGLNLPVKDLQQYFLNGQNTTTTVISREFLLESAMKDLSAVHAKVDYKVAYSESQVYKAECGRQTTPFDNSLMGDRVASFHLAPLPYLQTLKLFRQTFPKISSTFSQAPSLSLLFICSFLSVHNLCGYQLFILKGIKTFISNFRLLWNFIFVWFPCMTVCVLHWFGLIEFDVKEGSCYEFNYKSRPEPSVKSGLVGTSGSDELQRYSYSSNTLSQLLSLLYHRGVPVLPAMKQSKRVTRFLNHSWRYEILGIFCLIVSLEYYNK